MRQKSPDDKLSLLRIFLPYLRRQRGRLCIAFLMLLLSALIRLLEPWPLSFAIDLIMETLSGEKISSRIATIAQWDAVTWLWLCGAGVLVIAALKAAIGYAGTIGLAIAGSHVLSEVRRDLFAHLLRLPLSFHRQCKTGDLTIRLSNDIGMLREVAVTALMPLLSSVIVLIGMFSVMLFLDWKLTLIALLPMPILLWSSRRSGKKIRDVSRVQRKREGQLAAKVAEYMSGIATVQALSLEEITQRSFNGNDGQSLQHNVQAKRLAAGLERKTELLIAFATAIVLLNGAHDVLLQRMTPGELLIFLSYLKNAFRPIREYAKYTGRLAKAITAAERITELLCQPPEIVDRPDAQALPATPATIRWENVWFSYGRTSPEQAVLRGISFTIPAGKSVAVVGPSGAGKSTLTRLLLRLCIPDSGTITFDGQDISQFSVSTLRQQIGYVPQENLLFGLSVRENIVLAAHQPVSDEELIAAARLVNAHDFIMQLPHGYDTVLSEYGATLSGGQRQRIVLARAALRQTPFLILDEPSVGLDSKNEREVNQALLQLMQQRTTLMITHNLALAARTQHILLIHEGKIAEQGTHEELMQRHGRYAEMWRLQQNTASDTAKEVRNEHEYA
jgi:ATP-binding cassette subfamily B protein